VYIITLIFVIKKNKLDLEIENNNLEIDVKTNEESKDGKYEDNNDIPSDQRIIYQNKKNNGNNSKVNIDNDVGSNDITVEVPGKSDNATNNENEKELIILLVCFIICQIFYFIELVSLSSFLGKTKYYEKKSGCENLKYIKKIYATLIIFGWILFIVLFVLGYIYLIILYTKCAKGAKKRLEILTNGKCCECFNACIKKVCNKCIDFFKVEAIEETEKRIITKKLEEKKERLKKLEKYKNDLEDLNSILGHSNINKKNIGDEFDKLHLNYLTK